MFKFTRVTLFSFSLTAAALGACTDPSNTTTTDQGALDAPTSLQATGEIAAVTLTWDVVSDAAVYVVSRSTASGSGYAEIATATVATYSDMDVAAGTAYFYVVQARNDSQTSENSAEASATPFAGSVLADLSAVAGDRKVDLTWSPSSSAEAYQVLRGVSPGGPYTEVASTTEAAFSDSSVLNRQRYYYIVRTTGTENESEESNEANAYPYRFGGEVCLVDFSNSDILFMSADVTGAAQPVAVLDGERYFGSSSPEAGLTFVPGSDTLFVSDSFTRNVVSVYDAFANAPFTAPSRQITRFEADSVYDDLLHPSGSTVAVEHGELYVVDTTYDRVHVFAVEENGESVAPTFYKAGTFEPVAVAYSSVHQEVYVLDDSLAGAIYVFDRSAALMGQKTPTRTITGANTSLKYAKDIIYNPHEDTFIVANRGNNTILTFARNADGNAAPIRSFAATSPAGIALAAGGDEILVVAGSYSVLGFSTESSTTTGVTATRTISGGFTKLSTATDIVVSNGLDGIAVLDSENILIFDASADGNVEPIRLIGGTKNGLVSPKRVVIDPMRNELHVQETGSVLTFPLDTPVGSLPLRSLEGAFFGIDVSPTGLWAGYSDDLLRFAHGSSANDSAAATATSLFADGYDLQYDPVLDEVWVYDDDWIRVCDPLTLAEKRSLQLTGASGDAFWLAVDGVNGEVFVFQSGGMTGTPGPKIVVYGADLTSAVARRTLTWPESSGGVGSTAAPMAPPPMPEEDPENAERGTMEAGIAYDMVNREIIAALNGSIYFYAREATGEATPLRKITLGHLGVTINRDVEVCK